MRPDVANDLSDSAFDFKRVVWPAIRHRCSGGRIVAVETEENVDGPLGHMVRDFDILAGIDAWQMLDEQGVMRGIASRVQWGNRSWNSFTIREQRPNGARTEFEKRCLAIDKRQEGWLFPYLTVQAYLTEPPRHGTLLSAGIVRTVDLFKFARDRWDMRKSKINGADAVTFKAFFWDELQRDGYRVDIVRHEPPSGSTPQLRDEGEWDDLDTRRPPDYRAA